LRYGDLNDNNSIFKYCDEKTNKIIDKIMRFSKQRIYQMSKGDYAMGPNDDVKNSKFLKKRFMDNEYGRLCKDYHTKWADFSNKAYEKVEKIKDAEEINDMSVFFDT
jgi:hypothetical protein